MALCYKVNWRTKGTLLLKKRKVGIAGPLGHGVRDERPLQDCGAGENTLAVFLKTLNPELKGSGTTELATGHFPLSTACRVLSWVVVACTFVLFYFLLIDCVVFQA